MSTKHKHKHKHKQKHKHRKPPSVITQQPQVDIGSEHNEEQVPLPSIPNNNNNNHVSNGLLVLDDISEIEVDETFIRYSGQYIEPPHGDQAHRPKKNALVELQDQEPFNRRESFLADMHHQPYWTNKGDGHHPFQTPKSTNKDTPSFFNRNVVLNTDMNAGDQQKRHSIESLSDSPTDNDTNTLTSQSGTNKSLEMAIPEENELLSAPSTTDIYSIDDTPNHNGRITTFVRNGEMNPISLYKIEYQKHSNNKAKSHCKQHSDSQSHSNGTAKCKQQLDEDDSYESDHSDLIRMDGDIVHKRMSNGHNKRIITNSFLKASPSGSRKKVSFGPTARDNVQTISADPANNNNVNGGPTSPFSSPSLTPHLLIQSATNDNCEVGLGDMATLTPKTGNSMTTGYNNMIPIAQPQTSKTAPTSPLQQKFKFNPQVSSIKNQRHSVVSIAMIQKVRQKKLLLESRNSNSHAHGSGTGTGTNTPSVSVCSLDEEYDNDTMNVSYYNNDTHFVNNARTKPVTASHQVPFIQRSGTEDDILHHTEHQKHEKAQRARKLKKYRNGAQSTTTSPTATNTTHTTTPHTHNGVHSHSTKHSKYGWQKKAHSYRPQKERFPHGSDSLHHQSSASRTNSASHSASHSQEEEKKRSRATVHTSHGIHAATPISMRRTYSDITKNKQKKNNLIQEYKVPPATDIIHERHAKISQSKGQAATDDMPSLLTSMSRNIVRDRERSDRLQMNKIDIENLIPLTVSRYISYMAEKTGNPKLTPPQRWDFTTVAMFADVSGFTKLSEYLAKAGTGGAEKLAFYLNRYLEQLANKARKEGGDVFKFAGDAIIIVWPPDFEEEKLEMSRKKILREERIARAVQAARAIQNEFHNMEIIKGAITLSVKIGIGYGPSSLLFVGGQFGRIEYLMCGSALKQAFDCESYASPGDVIISKEAYQYVKEKYVYGRAIYDEGPVEVHSQGHTPREGILKRALSSKHASLEYDNGPMTATPRVSYDSEPIVYKVMLGRKKYKKVHSKALRSNGRYLISEHLQSFVPRAAWQRLKKRYKPWHGEQRAVTVLFINLDFNAYDHDNQEKSSGKGGKPKKQRSNLENMPQDLLQKAVKTTQKCIYRYKGSLNKFLFDDKGSTVIAVFGLPPIANFDDCTRGVLCALLIEQKMKTLRIKARIGVTTGRVYIGVVGAAGSASEYGILGDQVNLAARLMQHAIKATNKGGLGGEGVVVSDTTYAYAKECINIDWQRLQSTSVKGFSKEFIIWRPHWRKIRGDLSMKRNRFFIGWKETMDEIKSRLLKLTKSQEKSRGYVVAIHADHWGGATQFARQLLHEIHEQIYVVGTTNLAFNDEKLFAWKALLGRVVRECRILRGNRAIFKQSFIRFLKDTGGQHLVRLLPVLNELLNTNFVSSDEKINVLCPVSAESESECDFLAPDYRRFGHQKLKSYTPNKGALPSPDVAVMNESILCYRVEIIIHLLKQVSKYSTMVLLISKFQYMDLDDWNITQVIANKIYGGELLDVSLVLAGWSMDTASLTYLISPEEQEIACNFRAIKKLCWLEFVLPKWTKQEVRDFLKCEFDIEKPSKNVLHFIVNKTDGIPGMIKCLVHDEHLLFLKHGGHLDCSQIERCRDIQSGSRFSDINLPIPYAIQSYYTKMLDSLDQFTLLTIKCAAVIAVGQEFLSVSFSYDMLFSCHPLRSDMGSSYTENAFNAELHTALSLLERDRFVYKFKQNKVTQEMIRLSDHGDQKHKHDNETFYVFASGFLRDVTYGNMLYKQRSNIHKRVKKMLDREPFNRDELVQNCIRRHHLLSLHDGFYSNRDEVERKREQILNKNKKKGKHKNAHKFSRGTMWSFPECVLVIYISDVAGLPDALKASSYVTIHVGDDKGKALTSSTGCHQQYMSVVLSENILKEIEDESVGPCLTMRLWYAQNYRVDKTIGKFTLRLRDLYEKQLAQQMSLLPNGNARGNSSKRNSFNNNNGASSNNAADNGQTDLFVGYKMTVHVKQKKINKFHLDKQLYIESFIRFCSVDDGSKVHNNLQSLLPFAQQM